MQAVNDLPKFKRRYATKTSHRSAGIRMALVILTLNQSDKLQLSHVFGKVKERRSEQCPTNFSLSRAFDKLKFVGHQEPRSVPSAFNSFS
jgi:hypothetical protein